MAKIKHIFNGVPDYEVDNAVDDHGLLTVSGEQLLKKIGVIAEQGLIVEKSTIRNLAGIYNEWKKPIKKLDFPLKIREGKYLEVSEEPDLENRLDTSKHFIKLGIKIGEGTRIGKNVYLGLGVTIGKYCRISDFGELCMGSILHDRVYIGEGVIVCKDSEVETGSQLMNGAIVAPRTLVKRNTIILPGCVFTQNNKDSPKL